MAVQAKAVPYNRIHYTGIKLSLLCPILAHFLVLFNKFVNRMLNNLKWEVIVGDFFLFFVRPLLSYALRVFVFSPKSGYFFDPTHGWRLLSRIEVNRGDQDWVGQNGWVCGRIPRALRPLLLF